MNAISDVLSPRNWRFRAVFLLVAALVVVGGFWAYCVSNPAVAFLPAYKPGQWILYPTPADGSGRPGIEVSSEFRRSFVPDQAASNARLSLRSMKRCTVSINGRSVGLTAPAGGNWKQPVQADVAGWLRPGTNDISVMVFNDAGPPCLWLSLTVGTFGLISDGSWQASFCGAAWEPARIASTPLSIERGNALYGGESVTSSFRARAVVLSLFAALSCMAVVLGRPWMARCRQEVDPPPFCGPSRWPVAAVTALAVAWAALWCNNLWTLPWTQGFDSSSHCDYIDYILQHRALPLATQGFEMYQPPLYYLLCAGQLAIFHLSPSGQGGISVLRLFGMGCGIAIFTLAFLSLRLVFPTRLRQPMFGLLLAALLPANLYLCHYVTNEILATTLMAASVYLCLKIMADPGASIGLHAWLGLLLGLALLSKSSTLVAVPLIIAALSWNLWAKGVRVPRTWAGCLGTTLLICLGVSGWHYYRVVARFGNPLIGNWDAESGFHWWQQPGYRDLRHYTTFGQSLINPFFSGLSSFPDGIYSTLWGDGLYGGRVDLAMRPPWNYDLMAAGYWFALLPTAAIVVGTAMMLRQFIQNPQPTGFLLLGLPSLCAVILIYYSLKVPSYATAKAFYASSAMVPVCALAASGWDCLVRMAGRWRPALYAALGLWAVNAYASFWIRGQASSTQILAAREIRLRGRDDLAASRLVHVLDQDPHNAVATQLLAEELRRLGQLNDARALAETAVGWAPENAEARLTLGRILAQQGQPGQAAEQAKLAIQSAPDDLTANVRLAEWLAAAGRKQEAVAACREALRVFPAYAQTHYLLAGLYSGLGDRPNALCHFRLAAALAPDWPEAARTLREFEQVDMSPEAKSPAP